MLAMFERVLTYQLTVVEWVCIAVLLGSPYLAVGILWAGSHSVHFDQVQGVRLMGSLLGSIVFWPALWLSGVCAG